MIPRTWMILMLAASVLACKPGTPTPKPAPERGAPEAPTANRDAVAQPAAAGGAADRHAAKDASSCGTCHTTDTPSHEEPALKKCLRLETTDPDKGPGTVVLNELENRYQPVTFAHKLHAKMAGMGEGCASCHHHDDTGHIQPCKACHPVEGQSEDLRQPGLKGAYHRQCVACHREWSHSNACGFCHQRKGEEAPPPVAGKPDKSDIMGVPHPVVEAKDTRIYKTGFEDGPVVTFRHKEHIERFELQCVDCHRKESCGRCHKAAGAAAEPATPRKHHDPCQRCHTKDIEENCDTCHDKAEKPGFQHKWPLGDQHKDLSCRECHPKGKPIGKLDTSCGSCHEDPRHDDKQPPKNRTGATPHAGATAGKGA